MKKLNNKGFAISTIIYGLAIMIIMIVAILMATMAQNRSNTKNLAKQIEDELNRYTKTETTFKPSVDDGKPIYQEYVVPENGWYRIELWGCQGAGSGGRGAYTGGVIELEKGEVLYFYVGAHNTSGTIGRETDVRVASGNYDDPASYDTRIMVAAGGGTNADAHGGTLYGYSSSMKSYGGNIDVSSTDQTFGLLATGGSNTTNGTLVGYTKTFTKDDSVTGDGKIGQAIKSPVGSNGGGDGFWASNKAANGGSSYIAGYAGSYGLEKGKTTRNPRYMHYAKEYIETEGAGSGSYQYTTFIKSYYFLDGIMLPGVNTGDGKAQIEIVARKKGDGQTLAKKSNKLNNVRYIKDCVTGVSSTEISGWASIHAIAKGVNLTRGNSLTMSATETNCRRYELIEYSASNNQYPQPVSGTTRVYNLDEIAVFHAAGTDPENNVISVSSDGTNWTVVKNKSNSTKLSVSETLTGARISAYQYDSTAAIPDKGEYIILPVLYESKVLTARDKVANQNSPVTAEYYNGYKRQRWIIEKIANGEYKIIEQARFKALMSVQDENIPMNDIAANSAFNTYARNEPQIWNISAIGNGTYTIKTIVPAFDSTKPSGFILPQSNQNGSKKNQFIIGKNNYDTARFVLRSVDYTVY